MPEVNWLAVVAAALAAFVLGGLWYSPVLFAKPWLKHSGVDPADRGNPAMTFGLAFVLAFIASAVFAMFLGPKPAVGFATAAGFAAGAGWVATSFGINYLFERKSLALFLINGGYHTVQFTLIGLILGLWH